MDTIERIPNIATFWKILWNSKWFKKLRWQLFLCLPCKIAINCLIVLIQQMRHSLGLLLYHGHHLMLHHDKLLLLLLLMLHLLQHLLLEQFHLCILALKLQHELFILNSFVPLLPLFSPVVLAPLVAVHYVSTWSSSFRFLFLFIIFWFFMLMPLSSLAKPLQCSLSQLCCFFLLLCHCFLVSIAFLFILFFRFIFHVYQLF